MKNINETKDSEITILRYCPCEKKYVSKENDDEVLYTKEEWDKKQKKETLKKSVSSMIKFNIEEKLTVCNNIEQTIDAALEQAKAMRHSILKEAFEGEPFDEKTATHVRN